MNTLDKIQKNKTGKIIAIHQDEHECKLCTLGFNIGDTVTMIHQGHTCIIKIMDSKYAIHKKCLKCIEIE